MTKTVHATLLGAAMLAAASLGSTPAAAFLHERAGHAHGNHRGGCFVTTSPTHNTRGIRHWRNPCPHHERKHLNPYHPGHHRPHTPHPSPH